MAGKEKTIRIDAIGIKSDKPYAYLRKDTLAASGGVEVYLAQKLNTTTGLEDEDEPNMPIVAIKQMRFQSAMQHPLLREARILKLINEAIQPNEATHIVRIGAGGEPLTIEGSNGEVVLLELEYLDGKTLADWLDDDWESVRDQGPARLMLQATRYMLQLTEALLQLERISEAADLKIMHRDLKPANVMLTSSGLRLFDFNVSTDNVDHTQLGGMGTHLYRAPEIRIGEDYDESADMWSLGVIFWELLHRNKSPFSGQGVYANDFSVPFPTKGFEAVDDYALTWPVQIFNALLCHRSRRAKTPGPIHEMFRALEKCLQLQLNPPATVDEVLEEFDLIDLIAELRPSSQNSVVADIDDKGPLQSYMRAKTAVEDPLEAYLVERIEAALAHQEGAPNLLMLSGNAGDGKSYLIDRLKRHHLKDIADFDERIEYIADATHSLSPSQTQQSRLEAFFSGFASGEKPEKDLYLIAMNTGMVIKFFEQAKARHQIGAAGSADFEALYHELERQLGLRQNPEQKRFMEGIEVVNLDLRSLVNVLPGEGRRDGVTFFERMIEKLDPNAEDGLLTKKAADCETCPARAFCPVRFNLEAMQCVAPRRALVDTVRRAALNPEVHLSPRNLWAFLYRVITGGLKRYDVLEREEGDSLCDVIRKKYQDETQRGWLLKGHFTEQLYAHRDLGGVWSALANLDPAYTMVPKIDQLQTRLSVNKDLDSDPNTIRDILGGDVQGKTLAGLALATLLRQLSETFPVAERENAAVRRHVFFDAEMFDAYYRHGPYQEFEELLDAYATYSEDVSKLEKRQQKQLIELGELVKSAVVRSYGMIFGKNGEQKMLRVSQPNIRSSSMLLVETDDDALRKYFGPKPLIQRDLHIRVHLADGRKPLLDAFGYQPKLLNLSIAYHRLIIDQYLYGFLTHVRNGQQPSTHDLAQFQALRFVAERLGNKLAKNAPKLFVLNGDTGKLFGLSKNAFGDFEMAEAQR